MLVGYKQFIDTFSLLISEILFQGVFKDGVCHIEIIFTVALIQNKGFAICLPPFSESIWNILLFRHGIEIWKGKTMDSIAIIKHAYSALPSYSLQNLQRHFSLGTNDGQAHRAFTDVEWTLEIFRMSLQRLLDATNK